MRSVPPSWPPVSLFLVLPEINKVSLLTRGEISAELRAFAKELQVILRGKFVGLYVFGSFVQGGWRPGISDIDFICVLAKKVSRAEFGNLRALHRSLAKRPFGRLLEGDYETLKDLQALRFRHRSSVVQGGRLRISKCQLSADNVYALKRCGRSILGRSISALQLSVTKRDFLDAVWTMLREDLRELKVGASAESVAREGLDILRCLYALRTGSF